MADEAFALSPISARAAQPSEADYDAIRDAFMETSRGRWFLGEYAKRNRNADTRMVLDAVARIEEALAAQRQPPPDDKLPAALAAIRSAVDQASEAASAALAGLAIEDNLAPVRKGVRIIKEISWRWREIGADGRICDLIDSQVSAIEASCGQISEIDPRPDVSAAFDLIRDRIDGFREDGDETAPRPGDVAVPAAPAKAEPEAAVIAEDVGPELAVAGDVAPEPIESEAAEADATKWETAVPVEAAPSALEVADETVDASHAEIEDEAILDMVALEMAAPDEAENDYFSAIEQEEADVVPQALAEAAVVAEVSAPVQARDPAPQQPLPPQPSLQPSPPAPEPQRSLGSTLLANGFLEQHRAPVNDPLAPIRRMSQAERVAFFS